MPTLYFHQEPAPQDQLTYHTEHALMPGQASERDPLAPVPVIDFDWQALYAALDESERATGDDYSKMIDGFREVALWATAPIRYEHNKAGVNRRLEISGLRMLALMHVLDPGCIEGTPSGRALSQRLGLNRSAISELAAQISARFGVRTRVQAHGKGKAPAARGPDGRRLSRSTAAPV